MWETQISEEKAAAEEAASPAALPKDRQIPA